MKQCGPITYMVKDPNGKGRPKTAHLNSLKAYTEREKQVSRQSVLAEGDSEKDVLENMRSGQKIEGQGSCIGFSQVELETLDKFQDALSDEPWLTHLSELTIDTGDANVCQNPYRPPERLLDKVLEEIKVLLGKGIIELSKSEWASPIMAVPKPSGNVRICVDFRRLNTLTKPIPTTCLQ